MMSRPQHLCSVLTALCLLTGAARGALHHELGRYGAWPAIRIGNGEVEVVVLPGLGGRIIDCRRVGAANAVAVNIDALNKGLPPGGIKDGLSATGVAAYPGSFMDVPFTFQVAEEEGRLSVTVRGTVGEIAIRRQMSIYSRGTRLDIHEQIQNTGRSTLRLQPRLHAEFALGWPNFKAQQLFFRKEQKLRSQPLSQSPGKVDSGWLGCVDLSHGEALLMSFRGEQIEQIYTGVWGRGTLSTIEPFGQPRQAGPGESASLDLTYWLVGGPKELAPLRKQGDGPSKESLDALDSMYGRLKRDGSRQPAEERVKFVPVPSAALVHVRVPPSHEKRAEPLRIRLSARSARAGKIAGRLELVAQNSGKPVVTRPIQLTCSPLAEAEKVQEVALDVSAVAAGKFLLRVTGGDRLLAPPPRPIEMQFGFYERLTERRREREARFRASISSTRHRVPVQWSGGLPPFVGFPVQFGIPLPRGLKRSVEDMAITRDGEPVSASFEPLGLWPDGSLQWVLARFQADPTGEPDYAVELASEARGETGPRWESPAGPDTVKRSLEALGIQEAVASVTVARRPGDEFSDAPFTDHHFVAPFSEAVWQIEQDGPMVRTFRAEGWHKSDGGERFAPFVFRADLYADGLIRIQHTFVYSGEPEEDFVSDVSLSFRLARAAQFVVGDSRVVARASGDVLYAVQDSLDHWEIRRRDRQGHETLQMEGDGSLGGWAACAHDDGGLCVVLRHARENNPKSFTYDTGEGLLRVGLYPREAKRLLDVRRYHKRISAGHPDHETGTNPSTAQGFAKTHEVWLLALRPGEAAERCRELTHAVDHPPVPWLGSDWYAGTEAAGYIHPYDPEKYPKLEAAARLLCDVGIILTERARLHNFINFGDWLGLPTHGSYFGRGRYGWTNNDAHPARALYYTWLRTGDRAYYDALAAMSWHAIDVDLVHYADGTGKDWTHTAMTLGRTRRHSRAHWSLYSTGPWTDGVAQYFLLTGEPRLLEALVFSADHGTHLANLARLLSPVAASRRYRDRLDRFTRAVKAKMEGYTKGKGTFRWGWEVLPGALDYFEWTGDPEAGSQLLQIAPKSGMFTRVFGKALVARLIGDKEAEEAFLKAVEKWRVRGDYPREKMASPDLDQRLDALYDLVKRDSSTWQEANYSLPASQIPFALAILSELKREDKGKE